MAIRMRSWPAILAQRQILLAAALLVLMLAIFQGLENPVGRTLALAHFGLFLLWQPVVRARYRLGLRDLLVMAVLFGAVITALSPGLMVAWVLVLAAVVAGRAFIAYSMLARLSYQLAVVFLILLLMLELLPSVVPGDMVGMDAVSGLMKYGAPLILLAIAALPAERRGGAEVLGGIDLLSSLLILLVLAVTVLGGLALMQIDGQPYFRALLMSVMGMAGALRDSGRGVMQLITDFDCAEEAFGLIHRLAQRAGRPLSFSLLEGGYGPMTPRWREVLDWAAEASREGLTIRAQVLSRAIGVMLGHELTLNPFYTTPTYVELAALPWADKMQALHQPEIRRRILAESADPDPAIVLGRLAREFDHMFQLGDPPDYEQPLENSIAARARRLGVTPEALAYDRMLEQDGRSMLYVTLCNYTDGSLEASLSMMRHGAAVLGLGDGGAHCGTICDGSFPTFMLAYWVRDRTRGERLGLSEAVRMLSRDSAHAVGLDDRGRVAVGYKADLNVIDLGHLHLHAPSVVNDLPTGGRRLIQRAEGYVATVVGGTVVQRYGESTGALPGRLVRGPQPAPMLQ